MNPNENASLYPKSKGKGKGKGSGEVKGKWSKWVI